VGARFGDGAGRRATELWRALHRIGWRPGEPAGEHVSRRQLRRMHTLAVALFADLSRPDGG
jgi:hypothetical protein